MKKIFIHLFLSFLFFTFQTYAQAPYWNWASTAGGNNSDRANAITLSIDGNILVTGFFQDTAYFGSMSLGTANAGMFLAKYNFNGNLTWAKKIADTDNGIEPQKIFQDSSGNIFITGYFGNSNGGSVDFVSGPVLTSYAGRDFFAAKFQSNGTLIWVRHIGSVDDDKIASTVSASGIYFQGSRLTDLIAQNSTTNDTLFTDFNWHLWSLAYDTSGQIKFIKDVATSTAQMTPIGIASDDVNNFYLTGNYYGHPSVGIYPDTSWLSDAGGLTNIYLLKFYSDSVAINLVWQQFIGGVGNDYSQAMDLKQQNEILLTGIYANTCYFGNDSGSISLNSAVTGNENFICSYQSNGNLISAENSGYSIAGGITTTAMIHDDSLVYICGKYTGAAVLGEGADTFSLVPVKNFFVAAFSDSGSFHWSRGSLSSFINGLNAITLDDSGHVYAAGYYTLYCVIDTGTTDSLYIPSAGVDDVFIGRLGYKILIEDTTIIIDTTSVTELSTNSISVFPNPADEILIIRFNQTINNGFLEIFSVSGKKIFNQAIINSKYIAIDVSSIPAGTYFIKLKTPDKFLSGKFSVARDE